MPELEHGPENLSERPACVHDFQLETVGDAYLTGAYVCRLCSHRVGMADGVFHKRNAYPRQYQAAALPVEPGITKDESDPHGEDGPLAAKSLKT